MISMQKLNQLLVKKPVIAGEFLFIAIVGYFILGSSTDKPKATAPKQNIAYEKKENISEAKQIPIDFSKNPFGDISEFENSPGADGSFTGQLTRIPAIPHGQIPIPSLPEGIPKPGSSAPVAVTAPKVSGIVTSNSGENIAIMSDGRVVSSGDTFNSNRIAYIGGDGITFDNGDFWAYGDAQ